MDTNKVVLAVAAAGTLFTACRTFAQQPMTADVPAIANQIVQAFAEQAATMPDHPRILLAMGALRTAAAKLGPVPTDAQVAEALPKTVGIVERPETATAGDGRQVYLVGDPYVISIRSLDRGSAGTVTARVETAFNGPPQNVMRIRGSIYLVELRKAAVKWVVVSKKVVGHS